MVASRSLSQGISWMGLVLGPGSWGAALEANFAFADFQCAHGVYPTPWISFAAAAVALVGAAISERARRSPEGGSSPPERIDTRRFVAGLSVGTALIFALVNVMQGGAALIFTGCER
jgi:hypothetical protein